MTARPEPMHAAARTEDALNRALSRLLSRRGWKPRIIPYVGYGVSAGGVSADGDVPEGWVRVLARVLLSPLPGSERAEEAVRGWRHFLSAKLGGVPVRIDVGGTQTVVECARGGYVDVVLPAALEPGWATAELRIAGGAVAEAPVRVVGAHERLGVLSDIDDTVLVTALPRPFLAFWNTFVRREETRRSVPGMSEVFAAVTADEPDPFVVYLSTGAWNLAPALQRFLRRGAFPEGPLLLTDWGPTPEGWFRSGQDHKRRTLRRLMDELPQLSWVLIGDDGQHDPALYEELVWARPDRVRVVAIRELGVTEQVLTHGTPTPLPGQRASIRSGSSVPWVRGPTGRELVAELRRLRLTGTADDQSLAPPST